MNQNRVGVLCGLGAYALWGIFPLYFRLLDASGALEILGHRVLWSLIFCLMLVLVLRKRRDVSAIVRNKRVFGFLSIAAVAVAANWGIYIYAVNSDQVIEASLGYFINPIITVVLGVVVLRERLRPAQWVAVGIGVVAVIVLTIAYGHAPLIAISLAVSFGLYGLLKNRVGGQVDALSGLTTETAVLVVPAIALIGWLTLDGSSTFAVNAPWQALLLITTGIVTVLSLLLFAGAARRIPLSTVGLLQYLTPVLQLLCGVVILNEHMPAARWFGFGLVWVALVVLTADGFYSRRRLLARAQVDASSAG